MKWVTWDQAMVVAVACAALVIVLRHLPRTRIRSSIISACTVVALLSVLYAIWRLARALPLDQSEGAIERARGINQLQQNLFFPSELSLQNFVLDHQWIARAMNFYYAILHIPALVIFLIWLFIRHRNAYSFWRNCLAILTGACLVIRFIRVAPPRFLPDLGYVDLAMRYGLSVYGPVGTGVSDQFAAMPSIHVGWAAVVSLGIVSASDSPWRWIFFGHLVLTMIAVSATGNHWWLDGIVAIVLLVMALFIERRIRDKIHMARNIGVVR